MSTIIVTPELAERFWSKVDRSGNCWIWTASRTSTGYGQINVNGRPIGAHRVSYALCHGDPTGMFVCHHCDTPLCVNPSHLFLGTLQDNNSDMCRKGRASGGKLAGNDNPHSVLTSEQVAEIRRRFVPGRRGDGPRAAAEFGTSVQNVHRILRGLSWQ